MLIITDANKSKPKREIKAHTLQVDNTTVHSSQDKRDESGMITLATDNSA